MQVILEEGLPVVGVSLPYYGSHQFWSTNNQSALPCNATTSIYTCVLIIIIAFQWIAVKVDVQRQDHKLLVLMNPTHTHEGRRTVGCLFCINGTIYVCTQARSQNLWSFSCCSHIMYCSRIRRCDLEPSGSTSPSCIRRRR